MIAIANKIRKYAGQATRQTRKNAIEMLALRDWSFASSI